ncbi:helix-turn-helix transcriptional regulator [Planomonospora sp. ID67723]|uniref:helix-turn-helix domain-containing protein n=1 Tax=Planomonospora sp. ID67723 TaxID=2738134 RepID=UPI0018C3ADD9|nr:helix-turn-helix transcriptional regulator [Planomonospora sp. ID67723]MBG0828519.1 helix-turn-helix transcriptional regulator [Planomonospora sp. ID67723]
MSAGKPSPYAALIEVLASLPLLLRETRRARGLSQRAAAVQIGVSFSTISRIEARQDCELSNAMAVLCWFARATPAPDPHEET